MRELRADTFSKNKNDNAHEHVERFLDIVSLFKIPGVTHDAVMLRVFPITLTGAAKRWVDRLSLGTIDSWDIIKKAFIQRYCPLSKTAKQLEDICNFKKEGDKTLYQAWERYNDMLYKWPTHDIKAIRRFNRGASRYDQPSLREKRPSLTKIINKYIEEEAKGHAEQDKWLKEFYQNTKINREAHDNIIQGLEIKTTRASHKRSIIYKTIESLKKLKINLPLLKEIRQTDDYAKHIMNLVANKSRTKEEEFRMNLRSSSHLQNQLPPKEQDPGSFILPYSIRRLNFNNALADLGASIGIMPLYMYKRLGIGKLEPINMMIEMGDNSKCTPKGLVENLLVKIDKLIFPVDFVILDIVEDIMMPIILGRPLLETAHAKVDIFRKSISLEVGNEKVIFKIRSSFDLTIFKSVHTIKSITCLENDELNKMDYDMFLCEIESCEFNHLLAIDPNIFTYDIEVQESYEEVVYKMTEQEDL
nr:hypothetical protein [Tanacetum cinerariifolium]